MTFEQDFLNAVHTICGVPRGTFDRELRHALEKYDNENMAFFRSALRDHEYTLNVERKRTALLETEIQEITNGE